MADRFVYSTDEDNMREYPLWVQAPAGKTGYPYTVGDLRMLIAPSAPTAGVAHYADFRVTSTIPGYVTVSDGVGVTAPTGVAGAKTRERYLFASDGPVNVPVFANTSGTTKYHRLVAMAHDEQLPMSASFSPWSFHLIEDDGTPPVSNGPNAIPLATIRVDPNQTSGYVITDLRYPCNHPMSCKLSRNAATTALNGGSDYGVMRFNHEDDDPYHQANVTTDDATIYVRTNGLYDLEVGLAAPATTGEIEVGIYVDSTIANPTIISSTMRKTTASSTGTHLTSVTLGEYLDAGTQVRAYIWATTPNLPYDRAWLKVLRREWRP